MSVESQELRVLAAGDCSAVLSRVTNGSGTPLRVHTVTTAAEVLSQLEEIEPDLVFVDADCMQLSGIELCRVLKEQPTTMLFPVVVFSRYSRRRIEAFSAGADDFVTRQIPRELFIARIESLARMSLARRRAASELLTAEIRRGEELRQTFRRYLSPPLADKILGDIRLSNSILTSDVRTRAVVMFADLRGFTAISERLRPHEVVPLLNEYFSLLTEITFNHGGTVFHMAGDCLMAGFGVPLEQTDGPERAFRAAQEMLDRFASLAEKWKERHNIETGLGIGINEGDVVAGNVGSSSYMNYTIIGDTVNVASRLCQRARAGEMVFSRAVKDSLDARGVPISAVELPPMTLRGRTNPIDIYCVPLEKRLDISDPVAAP
jgi:class 3 adenylate cyclase